MNSCTYEFPSEIRITDLLTPLADAEDAVARLDERLRLSPYGTAVVERSLCREACASAYAEGAMVHLEDLVLLDGWAFDGSTSPELSAALQVLGAWRKAWRGDARKLLTGSRPGEDVEGGKALLGLPNWLADAPWDNDRLEAWRSVQRRSSTLPPLLAAGIVWDAWLMLMPEGSGGWRAPLLAALAMKARGKTRSFLAPLMLGWRHASYRRDERHEFATRMAGFCEWVTAATAEMDKDLKRLGVAGEMLRRHVEKRRKHSRLGGLANLLLTRPFVSVTMAAKALNCSPQAIRSLLPLLGSVPREMTGRQRYRVWSV